MGAGPSAPSEELAAELADRKGLACKEAAAAIRDAEVLLLCTGAGFSADSGLAVYADVAKVAAYASRGLEYYDLCQPHWLKEEPELFWGFWGQCFNDYRATAPHDGYRMIDEWANRLFRNSDVATRIRARLVSRGMRSDTDTAGVTPYIVQDRAGAFFAFTSNVDAHHFDWFRACEIRECHGNTEQYQCANLCTPAVWRAPASLTFQVDKTTMLAPTKVDPAGLEAPVGSLPDGDEVPDAKDDVPRIGEVQGSRRNTTLRYMPAPHRSDDSRAGFESNHPLCRACGGPARPAILMFADDSWADLDGQESRWQAWREAVRDEASERVDSGQGPLRVAILEVGAGNRVTTVRGQAESNLRKFLDAGADAKLIRVNPDFPLGDAEAYAPAGQSEKRVISIMARGFESLQLINAALGSGD